MPKFDVFTIPLSDTPPPGTYIFIETSAPRRRGQKAWLQSAIFSPTGSTPRCLHFWASMYGSGIGSLNVYLANNQSTPGTKLWSLAGNQGRNWFSGQVSLQSNQQYTVSPHTNNIKRKISNKK